MPLEVQTKRRSIALQGELNIYTAREFHDRVLPQLREAKKPTLDLAQIAEFDCAGLQGLLVALREAEAAGKELNIVEASAAIREALDLLQCDPLRARLGSRS